MRSWIRRVLAKFAHGLSGQHPWQRQPGYVEFTEEQDGWLYYKDICPCGKTRCVEAWNTAYDLH